MTDGPTATPGPIHGAICHIEIPAPDLEIALEFYGGVFGWEVRRMAGMEEYVIFMDTTGGLGGGFDPSMKPSDAGLNIVIAVPDVDKALAHIAEAGGTVVKGRTEIGGGMGFYGLFLDPNGNRLGVWAKL